MRINQPPRRLSVQRFEIRNQVGAQRAALLTSTFTFGMVSLAIKYERGRSQVASWLLVTLELGLVFFGLETREFAGTLAEGAAPQQSDFLSARARSRRVLVLGCLIRVILKVQKRCTFKVLSRHGDALL
jgi:hypothetical protein